MPGLYYGLMIGIVLGLVIATVVLEFTRPPDITYDHMTLDGVAFDCLNWKNESICEPRIEAAERGNEP